MTLLFIPLEGEHGLGLRRKS